MMELLRWIYLQIRSVPSDSMCHDYLFYFLLEGKVIIDEAKLGILQIRTMIILMM